MKLKKEDIVVILVITAAMFVEFGDSFRVLSWMFFWSGALTLHLTNILTGC
jgi:hypothetical protein